MVSFILQQKWKSVRRTYIWTLFISICFSDMKKLFWSFSIAFRSACKNVLCSILLVNGQYHYSKDFSVSSNFFDNLMPSYWALSVWWMQWLWYSNAMVHGCHDFIICESPVPEGHFIQLHTAVFSWTNCNAEKKAFQSKKWNTGAENRNAIFSPLLLWSRKELCFSSQQTQEKWDFWTLQGAASSMSTPACSCCTSHQYSIAQRCWVICDPMRPVRHHHSIAVALESGAVEHNSKRWSCLVQIRGMHPIFLFCLSQESCQYRKLLHLNSKARWFVPIKQWGKLHTRGR